MTTLNKLNKTKQIKENKKEKTEIEKLVDEKIKSENVKVAIYDFIKMRKATKKPMTTKAVELLIDTLYKLSKVEAEQIMILNKSTMNNWQGIYKLKAEGLQELGKAEKTNMEQREYKDLSFLYANKNVIDGAGEIT